MARMLEGVVVNVLHRRGNAIARLPEKPSPPRGQAHSTAWPGLAKATSRVMSRRATETATGRHSCRAVHHSRRRFARRQSAREPATGLL